MSLIEDFEKDRNPIFVIYGASSHFEDVISSFHHRFQKNGDDLYLPLDMKAAKCSTLVETIFEIVQQLGYQLIEKIPESDKKNQLYRTLCLFQKLNRETRDCDLDVKLAKFVPFAEYSFYPTLEAICRKNQGIIGSFEGFEEVVQWGSAIRNFILDSLLRKLAAVDLRFVLFVQSDDQPRLFYGSDEENTRKKVTFHKCSDID